MGLRAFFKGILFFSFLFLWINSYGNGPDKNAAMVGFLEEYLSIKYPNREMTNFLYVAAKQQKMFHVKNGRVVGEYIISTAKEGVGSEAGSFKTPVGLHRIFEKSGDGVPLGGIIKSKQYNGLVADIEKRPISTGKDELTSRAIHLEGMEPGINKGGNLDSFERAIFIHGTPEEGLLGTKASRGCIRMSNEDIMELYELTFPGMLVVILNN